MGKALLTHRPTRDPEDAQPSRSELDTVAEALALTYKLGRGRGFQVGIEVRKDGQAIYDESALSNAVSRISGLVNDGMSLEMAAEQVAREDGHFD
jgi:hypothetical protein